MLCQHYWYQLSDPWYHCASSANWPELNPTEFPYSTGKTEMRLYCENDESFPVVHMYVLKALCCTGLKSNLVISRTWILAFKLNYWNNLSFWLSSCIEIHLHSSVKMFCSLLLIFYPFITKPLSTGRLRIYFIQHICHQFSDQSSCWTRQTRCVHTKGDKSHGSPPHLHCWETLWSTWPGWTSTGLCSPHLGSHHCIQTGTTICGLKWFNTAVIRTHFKSGFTHSWW